MVLDDPKNINDIENVLLLAKRLGAQSFIVNPAMDIGRGKDLTSFNDEELKEFTLKHNELILKYPDFYGLETVSWDRLKSTRNCGAGSNKIAITSEGKIKFCSMQSIDWIDLGNIYDIKENKIQKKIKTSFELSSPSEEVCNDCEYTFYCMKCIIRPLNLLRNNKVSKEKCKWFLVNQEKFDVLDF